MAEYRYIIKTASVVDQAGHEVGRIEHFNNHGGGTFRWSAGGPGWFGANSEASGVEPTYDKAKAALGEALKNRRSV